MLVEAVAGCHLSRPYSTKVSVRYRTLCKREAERPHALLRLHIRRSLEEDEFFSEDHYLFSDRDAAVAAMFFYRRITLALQNNADHLQSFLGVAYLVKHDA